MYLDYLGKGMPLFMQNKVLILDLIYLILVQLTVKFPIR